MGHGFRDDAQGSVAGGGRRRSCCSERGPAGESGDGGDAGTGQTHRHRARGDPDSGEPIVRSLLRHDGRCSRLQRRDRRRENRAARHLVAGYENQLLPFHLATAGAPQCFPTSRTTAAPAHDAGRRGDGRFASTHVAADGLAAAPRRWATRAGRRPVLPRLAEASAVATSTTARRWADRPDRLLQPQRTIDPDGKTRAARCS